MHNTYCDRWSRSVVCLSVTISVTQLRCARMAERIEVRMETPAASKHNYRLGFRDHVTDADISLHWLRVPERVKYQVAVLTYKALHDTQNTVPRYLGPLVRAADIPGRRVLRSAVTDRLAVPSVRLPAGHFRLPPRKSGTVCRTTSCLLHLSLPSVAY